MFKALFSKLAGWLGLLGGLVLAGLALLHVGWRQGRAQAQQKQEKAAAAERGKVREVDNKVDSMGDRAVRDRGRLWVRNDDE